jgi:hypothetical protein
MHLIPCRPPVSYASELLSRQVPHQKVVSNIGIGFLSQVFIQWMSQSVGQRVHVRRNVAPDERGIVSRQSE